MPSVHADRLQLMMTSYPIARFDWHPGVVINVMYVYIVIWYGTHMLCSSGIEVDMHMRPYTPSKKGITYVACIVFLTFPFYIYKGHKYYTKFIPLLLPYYFDVLSIFYSFIYTNTIYYSRTLLSYKYISWLSILVLIVYCSNTFNAQHLLSQRGGGT